MLCSEFPIPGQPLLEFLFTVFAKTFFFWNKIHRGKNLVKYKDRIIFLIKGMGVVSMPFMWQRQVNLRLAWST